MAVTEIDKILERFKKSNELLELIQKVRLTILLLEIEIILFQEVSLKS